jgi:hypothetical protein
MKRGTRLTAIAGLLFAASAMPCALNAAEYWGEYCWEAIAQDESVRQIRFGVSNMGDSHFQLAGTFGTADSPHPAHGNAELIGSNIHLAFTWAYHGQGAAYYRVASMVVNTGLSGNLRVIGTKVDLETGEVTHGKGGYTVTPVPCP